MSSYVVKSVLSITIGVAAAVAIIPANAAEPIRIGVIAPTATLVGRGIMDGATLAADQINAQGGIDGRPIKLYKFDSHASATDSIRAFQRAVDEDHVIAVMGNYISEAAMATQPWSARLKEIYIATGPADMELSKRVHDDYAQYKYSFRSAPNSVGYAQIICIQAKDILADQLHYKTAAIMAENYAWTGAVVKELDKCLPASGLKVVYTVKVAPNTDDFSPVYQRIEAAKPDVIVSVLAHMGIKPTIQWHQERVPLLLAGWSSQAGAGSFWKHTNGAAQGEVTSNLGAPGAAVTAKSVPFQKAYVKQFHEAPSYGSYATYDGVYILKDAIVRAHSTNADALVTALEATDYEGTMGHEVFYPKSSEFAHDLRVGEKYIPGVVIQWQNGKQVTVWPKNAANGNLVLPSFVKKK